VTAAALEEQRQAVDIPAVVQALAEQLLAAAVARRRTVAAESVPTRERAATARQARSRVILCTTAAAVAVAETLRAEQAEPVAVDTADFGVLGPRFQPQELTGSAVAVAAREMTAKLEHAAGTAS
jgi:hypothetical protein